MPGNEVQAFKQNLAVARNLVGAAVALAAQAAPVFDVSDLLRAALVLGVSAFDLFMHDEVRVRMLALESGPAAAWPDAFARFRISMASYNQASQQPGQSWFENEIRNQHGFLAFQQPEKVADAIRLVSGVSLWTDVGVQVGRPAIDVKTQLAIIVDRRNKIVHEADIDPTPPPSRFPITRPDVEDSLDFVETLVDAIAAVL